MSSKDSIFLDYLFGYKFFLIFLGKSNIPFQVNIVGL